MTLIERIGALATAIGDHIKTAIVPRLLPSGGTAGHVLTKTTGADYDASWAAPSGGGGSGQIDGGGPSSVYGGTAAVDGGAP